MVIQMPVLVQMMTKFHQVVVVVLFSEGDRAMMHLGYGSLENHWVHRVLVDYLVLGKVTLT